MVFRLHADRVFYCSERVMKAAIAFPRDDLVSLGVCFGKFTRSGKFHLKVTCLDLLAAHARHKVWVKPSAEMSFLYGNDIAKSGVARSFTPRHACRQRRGRAPPSSRPPAAAS